MAITNPKHDGCGGAICYKDGAWSCADCNKDWITNAEKHEFLELHRSAIQRDVVELGSIKARKRWHIPSSTFSQLLKKWTAPETPAPPPVPVPKSDKHLPELPAFSNDWTAEVQVKWLEVWSQRR